MTDQLIFVHDKRRDAYVDKTSEIVGLRPAGAYVYVDYGAAPGIPLSQRACSLLSPARHTPAGTHLQGRNVAGAVRYAVRLREICPAGRRRGLAFAGDREVADRSGRCAAAPRRQRAATFLFRGGSRSQSLSGVGDRYGSRRGGSRRGEEKFDRRPARRDDAAHRSARTPVRRCMPI